MNAAAGAEQIGNVRLVTQRMSGGIDGGDLRSLVGDIRGKFGEERLASLVSGTTDSAGALVSRIVAAVDEFASGAAQADDITLLAVRFR